MDREFFNMKDGGTTATWLGLFVSIPLLSIYGRGLQLFIVEHVSQQVLAWAIGIVLLLLTVKGVSILFRHGSTRTLWHLSWFVPLFLIVPWFFPIVEERIHFIVFGLFGFYTLLLLPARYGYMLCLLVAFADEGLQWMLADRVGDMRDVAVNLLAAWAGAAFAAVTRKD